MTRALETTAQFLRERLAQQTNKNPSFSLRALARDLDTSPSFISEVMKNPQLKATILDKLDQLNPVGDVERLSVENFRLVSEWYHIPILELTEIPDFEFTPATVGRRLGISSAVAGAAIDRLIRLNLLAINSKTKKYQKTNVNGRFESKDKNTALQTFHAQMLKLADDSLRLQSPQEKIVGSETLAFDPRDLDKVDAILKDAVRKLSRLSEQSKKRTEVYHLGLQFFRLTRKDSSTN